MSATGRGSRPIRVLHLRDSPWVDGPGRTILETATRIDRSRVDYHVGAFVSRSTEPHPLVEALQQRGLPVHPIEDRGGVGSAMVSKVVDMIDRLEIDVLHTSEFRSNVLALLCRRKRPIKLVSTAHGWIANDLRGHLYLWADRLLLRQFDRVILVSHAMRQRLPPWWVPDSRVQILHNALMIETYGRELLDRPRLAPDPSGEVRLLNVGRLSVEKGQDHLLRAVGDLTVDYPRLQLFFAGVGPFETRLRQLAAQIGIEERVRFLGYVGDMPALYASVDLVVQSSLTEGLPNVIVEGAYLGVPIVATDVGGTREVIEHGVSGWLVQPGDHRALSDAMRRYLSDPSASITMAARGRARIESRFEFSARTESQMQIYTEIARDVD
ncbi:MAG: glycosyltransferase family 4 protein [Steroidobacteraceae bacterium]|nr:glycosyltransferase family 4 protein [Steroidobacteraceae bacterium]